MSKVTLISFYPGFFGINLRQIGSCLNKSGFEVTYLHLGYSTFVKGTRFPSLKKFTPTQELIRCVLNEISGSLYVGISLAVSEFAAARDLSIELKKYINIPIIWGGPHPTASYEDSVRYADTVCVGEGEKTAVELAEKLTRKQDIYDIPNLAYLKNGVLYQNPPAKLVEDLDALPVVDTRIYEHKIFFEGKLQLITPELLVDLDRIYVRPVPDKIIYITTLSRGCPNSCTYCNNSYLKRIYSGQKYFRFRSLDNLFEEIKEARKNVKEIGAVFLADDNITALPARLLKEFCDRWKLEVGIPFGASGSPATIKDKKIEMLAGTGLLFKFGIGVESASRRILDIYNRKETPEQALKAIAVIEKYRPMFYQKFSPPLINYQFIFDNPYETVDDVISTLKFIVHLPVRKSITCFHLVMYPGSEIYNRAVKDAVAGKNKDIYMEEFVGISSSFAKVWLMLFEAGFPRLLLSALLLKPIYLLFDLTFFRNIYKKIELGS